MLITKLNQYQIIFGKLWMKKRSLILNMRNDTLTFWLEHYQHMRILTYDKLLHVEKNRKY